MRSTECPSSFEICLQSVIGFGKLESYTKLDKLGEVSSDIYCYCYCECFCMK